MFHQTTFYLILNLFHATVYFITQKEFYFIYNCVNGFVRYFSSGTGKTLPYRNGYLFSIIWFRCPIPLDYLHEMFLK